MSFYMLAAFIAAAMMAAAIWWLAYTNYGVNATGKLMTTLEKRMFLDLTLIAMGIFITTMMVGGFTKYIEDAFASYTNEVMPVSIVIVICLSGTAVAYGVVVNFVANYILRKRKERIEKIIETMHR